MNDDDKVEAKPIIVSTNGESGPYISVLAHQLPKILSALHDAGIDCHKASGRNSDSRPPVDIINLGRGADVQKAQSVLDALD